MTDFKSNCIGLIADSHGNLEATAEAIRILRQRGAVALIHLGDFCDSVRHDRSAAMIAILQENGAIAVKGNNDFFIESMLADDRRPADPEDERTLAFLRDVPMTRALDGIRFAHSLPFNSLRAFYEPIDMGNAQRAAQLFSETDFQTLFCGHSHLPILFRKAGDRVTRESMPPDRPFVLDPAERYIFVVGAADNGECALFDPGAGIYERIRK